MTTTYFIIEHPTRGILKEEPNRDTGKPSFGLEHRTDERAARYFSLRRAIQDLQELDLPRGCQVRASKPSGSDGNFNEAWPVVWPR